MAIVGIGVDVVDVNRFASVITRTPDILDRLFVPTERQTESGHPLSVASLAGRFAVKEAVAKALGAPVGMSFHECRVSPSGKPFVTLSGEIKQIAEAQGITTWHVSISHDGPVAVAYVIAESNL